MSNDKERLTLAELYKEKDKYGVEHLYMKAVYEKENKYGKYEVTFPKINMNFLLNSIPVIERETQISDPSYSRYDSDICINTGENQYRLEPVEGDICYTEKVLEEYPQKMTLEEIERKLGYKIEVVSKHT